MGSLPATTSLFEYDLRKCGGGGEVAGADEAGRGCLAGPLVAAAVVFDYDTMGEDEFGLLAKLADSKRLTAKARESLYPLIIRLAARFSIVSASPETIDRDGLHQTNLCLLRQSLVSLAPCPRYAMVDGYGLDEELVAHEPVKKGDSLSAAIAAASVMAKVTRDRLMRELHEQYPQYGFDHHVGYSTESHRDAIAVHGLSAVHRRSFNTCTPLKIPGLG